uniref:Uncharacterized protein n=1 Tax=Magallana gigas TaxID=29159 RepID=K1RB47_MAGGI
MPVMETWDTRKLKTLLFMIHDGCRDRQLQSVKEPGPETEAQLATSLTDNYVIFNNVISNEGAAYDKSSSIFTCQSSGTYVFSWTTASKPASTNNRRSPCQ